jgi:hypothetical protein
LEAIELKTLEQPARVSRQGAKLAKDRRKAGSGLWASFLAFCVLALWCEK